MHTRPLNIYYRHNIALCVVMLTAFILNGCDNAMLGTEALHDSISVGLADTNCGRVPPFARLAPIKVNSILLRSYLDHDPKRDNFLLPLNILGRAEYEYGWTNTFAMLGGELRRGLAYIEVEAPKTSSGPAMKEFVALGGSPEVKYLKFEFAAEGSDACTAFGKAVQAMGKPMFQTQLLNGIPKGQCIATHAESEPTSNYMLRVLDLPDDRVLKPQHSEPPAMWELVDRRTNQVYAKLLRHMAVYGGSCPKIEIRRQFWSLLEADGDR